MDNLTATCIGDLSLMEWFDCQTPQMQTLLSTLITWFGTALGAAVVFVLPAKGRSAVKLLDCSMGFAAGVMLAASYWSLLEPALALSKEKHNWENLAWVPVGCGFTIGVLFVAISGILVPEEQIKKLLRGGSTSNEALQSPTLTEEDEESACELKQSIDCPRRQRCESSARNEQFKRLLALVIAITFHNIPEGAAVGVGYGAGEQTSMSGGDATVSGEMITLTMALQNFPEGLAISLPFAAAGESKFRAFFWGQLSGIVEPVFGLLGCYFVQAFTAVMPYALAFAAGAMVFVVVEDIVPDSCSRGHGALAARFAMVGFMLMMALDVQFG